MGQTTSCISGKMGWQEPYMPAKIISEIVNSEYQLNNAVPSEQQNINRRLTSLLALKCGCLDSNGNGNDHSQNCKSVKRGKTFITKSDSFSYAKDSTLKKSLFKEVQCKAVNFNQNEELKSSNKFHPHFSKSVEVEKCQVLMPPQSNKVIKLETKSSYQVNSQEMNLNRQRILYAKTPLSRILERCYQPLPDLSDKSQMIENCKNVVVLLTNHADNIATNFGFAVKATNDQNWKVVEEITTRICSSIHTLVQDYCKNGSLKHFASLSWNKVILCCDKLMSMINCNTTPRDKLKNQITTLGQELHYVMESLVLYELLVIIEEMKEETNCLHAMRVLLDLSKISDFMCCLIIKSGGVQAMFEILSLNKKQFSQVAFRVLTSLFTVDPALCQVKTMQKLQKIKQVVFNSKNEDDVFLEAIAFLAQTAERHDQMLTSQLFDDEELLLFLNDVVKNTKNEKILILVYNIFASLSLRSNPSRKMLIKTSIVKNLIYECLNKQLATSLAMKEQVATILTSVISYKEQRVDIIDNNLLSLLLSFVAIQPKTINDLQEKIICKRIQEKAAMALSLLCDDKKSIDLLINNKGIHQLLRVCKSEETSNSQSVVLLFCMLALQRLAVSCQNFVSTEVDEFLCKESSLILNESFV
ncbi:protein inscuteable homolog isoform X1 [Centruroides vittatus]|uniref:protein inscuteable homolog isoform X1 n=1 Tax=Centruroides vittatus TaxID=120091 RepID=UPI00350EBB90